MTLFQSLFDSLLFIIVALFIHMVYSVWPGTVRWWHPRGFLIIGALMLVRYARYLR